MVSFNMIPGDLLLYLSSFFTISSKFSIICVSSYLSQYISKPTEKLIDAVCQEGDYGLFSLLIDNSQPTSHTLECAILSGDIDIIRHLDEMEIYSENALQLCANTFNLEAYDYFYDQGYDTSCFYGILSRRQEIFDRFIEKYPDVDMESVIRHAVDDDNLEFVIKYPEIIIKNPIARKGMRILKQFKGDLLSRYYNTAFWYWNLESVEYLRDKCIIPDKGCLKACIETLCLRGDKSDYITWLLDIHPGTESIWVLYICASFGRIDLLEIIYSRGFMWMNETDISHNFTMLNFKKIQASVNVVDEDVILCLEWLKTNNISIPLDMVTIFSSVVIEYCEKNNIGLNYVYPKSADEFKKILSNEKYTDLNDFNTFIAINNDPKIIEWLVENSYKINTEMILDSAVKHHKLEIVKYIVDNFDVNISILTINVIKNNRCAILRYLHSIGKLDYCYTNSKSVVLNLMENYDVREDIAIMMKSVFFSNDNKFLIESLGIRDSRQNRCQRLYNQFRDNI